MPTCLKNSFESSDALLSNPYYRNDKAFHSNIWLYQRSNLFQHLYRQQPGFIN